MFFTNLFESNLTTKHIAKEVIYYTNIDSTNDEVWLLFKKKINTNRKFIVITDNQKQGRGRGANQWVSKPGQSITCSFLLKNIFSSKQFNLNAILIPVAIIKGIHKFTSISLGIKWPNDIMYNDKKLGGILIESRRIDNQIFLNIGIGLNINECYQDFPDNLSNTAISLREIAGHPIQREPLLACILNELDKMIDEIDTAFLINTWMENCIHINQQISFSENNKPINGVFKTINEFGQAVINNNNDYMNYDGAITVL